MRKFAVLLVLILLTVIGGVLVVRSFHELNRSQNATAPRPRLLVYAHSSFLGAYGPGPEIKEIFEKRCLCDVVYVDAGGAGLLLQKLQLAKEPVDVVVGLDQLSLKTAAMKVKFREFRPPERDWEQIYEDNQYSMFVAYDWSPMTFLHKTKADDGGSEEPPVPFQEFIKKLPVHSLALQDPSMSTPGLQFLYWMFRLDGGKSPVDLIQQLKPKVHSYSPDWSAAYGLFRRGLAPYTFSYLTSLVYHWQEENDFTYEAVAITEGHPVQIEYAGVPDTCLSCGIGQSFVGFLTEPAIQKIIMEKNFMLPVVRGIAEKAPYFQDLPHLKLLPPDGMEQFVDGKATLLQDWERASR